VADHNHKEAASSKRQWRASCFVNKEIELQSFPRTPDRDGPEFEPLRYPRRPAFAVADLDWREHVSIDPRYYRPAEVDALQADFSKAWRVLGWEPTVKFAELVRLMVAADLEAVQRTLVGGRAALPGLSCPDARLHNAWMMIIQLSAIK
jgi:GDP-D-mannose dehydratase